MAVRIRLTRVGATKQPTYRFVVADSRSARDGRSLETLGHYNPRADPIEIHVDEEKAQKWLQQGAHAVGYRRAPVPPRRHPARGQAERCPHRSSSSTSPSPSWTILTRSRWRSSEEGGGTVIELHVAEDDMGKVIGRNGSVAKALRTLLKVVATREGEPISLEIV